MNATAKLKTVTSETVNERLKRIIGELEDHELVLILRKRLNINQFQICSQTGILPQQLSAYEIGKRELPLEKVAKILEVLEEAKRRSCKP